MRVVSTGLCIPFPPPGKAKTTHSGTPRAVLLRCPAERPGRTGRKYGAGSEDLSMTNRTSRHHVDTEPRPRNHRGVVCAEQEGPPGPNATRPDRRTGGTAGIEDWICIRTGAKIIASSPSFQPSTYHTALPGDFVFRRSALSFEPPHHQLCLRYEAPR